MPQRKEKPTTPPAETTPEDPFQNSRFIGVTAPDLQTLCSALKGLEDNLHEHGYVIEDKQFTGLAFMGEQLVPDPLSNTGQARKIAAPMSLYAMIVTVGKPPKSTGNISLTSTLQA